MFLQQQHEVNGWRVMSNIGLGYIEFLHKSSLTKFVLTNHLLLAYGLTISDIVNGRRGVSVQLESTGMIVGVNRTGAFEYIIAHHFPPAFDLTLVHDNAVATILTLRDCGNTVHVLGIPDHKEPSIHVLFENPTLGFSIMIPNGLTEAEALTHLIASEFRNNALVIFTHSDCTSTLARDWFDSVGFVRDDGSIYLSKGVVTGCSQTHKQWTCAYETVDEFLDAVRPN